jgi:hypothetical protein
VQVTHGEGIFLKFTRIFLKFKPTQREAQMIWTVIVGFAVLVSAFYQMSVPVGLKLGKPTIVTPEAVKTGNPLTVSTPDPHGIADNRAPANTTKL